MGVWYEIDLCEDHYDELEMFVHRYLSVGRLYKPVKVKQTKAQKSKDLDKIRAWAAENNVEVSKRGRVAQAVIDAYNEAMETVALTRALSGSQGDHESPGEPVTQNPQDLAAGAAPAPEAQLVTLHDGAPTAFDDPAEGDDMPGTAASMNEPAKALKGKTKVAAGVRNPDGSIAGA